MQDEQDRFFVKVIVTLLLRLLPIILHIFRVFIKLNYKSKDSIRRQLISIQHVRQLVLLVFF